LSRRRWTTRTGLAATRMSGRSPVTARASEELGRMTGASPSRATTTPPAHATQPPPVTTRRPAVTTTPSRTAPRGTRTTTAAEGAEATASTPRSTGVTGAQDPRSAVPPRHRSGIGHRVGLRTLQGGHHDRYLDTQTCPGRRTATSLLAAEQLGPVGPGQVAGRCACRRLPLTFQESRRPGQRGGVGRRPRPLAAVQR